MATQRVHPWLRRIVTNNVHPDTYVQLRRFIPGTETQAPDTVISYIKLADLRTALGAAGGSSVVHNWEHNSVTGPISLKPTYRDFGPITELPQGISITNDTFSISLDSTTTFLDASVTAGEIFSPGDMHFYWRPRPIQGTMAYAMNALEFRDIDTADTAINMQYSEGAGITIYCPTLVGGNAFVTVLPEYVIGQPILVQYNSSTHTWLLQSGEQSATIQMTGGLNSTYYLLLQLYGYTSEPTDIGSVSTSLSSTDDFGSGLLPDPLFSTSSLPIELQNDAPFPSSASVGDFLYSLNWGVWNNITYEEHDVAVVTANGILQGAEPIGIGRGVLRTELDKIRPTFNNLSVVIGDSGDYPGLEELYQVIGERAWSGDRLTLTLRQNPFNGNQSVSLDFPSFKEVILQADPPIEGNLELGYVDLNIVGGSSPVYLKYFNINTLGEVTGDFLQLYNSQLNTGGFSLRRWSSNASSSINVIENPSWDGGTQYVKKELWDARDYVYPQSEGGATQASAITVNTVSQDLQDLHIYGNGTEITIHTNRPMRIAAGNIKAINAFYTGGSEEDYLDRSVMHVVGGGVVHLKSMNYGAANIRYVVSVEDGGIVSTHTSKIAGALPPIMFANQPVNVPTDLGLVQMDSEVPANAQIIRIPVFRPTETIITGTDLESFYVPYPIHLIGALAVVSTEPGVDDNVYVDITKGGVGTTYLDGQLIINSGQVTTGDGIDVVLNPTEPILAGTRLNIQVPTVTGSTAKGLDVYLIVIPTQVSPRPI